jgi:hypothetical protein
MLGLRHVVGGLWNWPDGLAWRVALAAGRRQRRRRVEAFLQEVAPGPMSRVLDVGVEARGGPTSNALLHAYPWPERLVAAGVEGEPEVCRERGITYVRADGCELPFDEGQFDVIHCNAVIEHVGSRERQRQFVGELCRVGRAVWVSTPNAASPLETHTLVPLAHWLPGQMCRAIYRAAGRNYFASEEHLNLLDAGELRSLFPVDWREQIDIRREWFCGLAVTLTAVGREERRPAVDG